ncbi:hypothetical protein AB1Y20_006326 [Prymnesium parvum]|uniref:NADP-dependent oxidoreductase domain-containing protein n=1 Tax=Prymnesium parvum TaxID=97485 RepID=A0AB34J1X5_PRYPA
MLALLLSPMPAAALVGVTTSGMTQRRLGNTDLLVSSCALGGMTWGAQNTDDEAAEQLAFAFDMGVNFVDTAEGYPIAMCAETQGKTDRAIAKWLRSSKVPRDQVVISTKVCGYNDRYTWFRRSGDGTQLSRSQIIESVDDSLKRLGVEYVDLLQFHWPERYVGLTGVGQRLVAKERSRGETPILEQCEALDELVKDGKIRHWGLSNENADGLAEFRKAAAAIGLAPPACMQNAYSLLQRGDEVSLVPDLLEDPKEAPCSYIAYSPLAAGVLSGKYSARAKPAKRSRLKIFKSYEESFKATMGPAAVDAYMQVARKHGLTPSQLALAHCNSRDFVTSTIIGATTKTQLAENLAAFQYEWSQELEDDVHNVYMRFPDPWKVQVAGGG